MYYSTILNYLIACCVDGGPVSTSAQSELHGINQPQSKVLSYTELCLLDGGTASRGASESVMCLKGKKEELLSKLPEIKLARGGCELCH